MKAAQDIILKPIITENVRDISAIVRSSIFKRLVEAVRGAILAGGDVGENDFGIRGCDILYGVKIPDGNIGDELSVSEVIRQHNIRTERKPRIADIAREEIRIGIVPIKER